MPTFECPNCKRTHSGSGKPFTKETLSQHIRDAHGPTCSEMFPLTQMIASDDMPDGAYFAMAHELGEL